MHQSQDTICAFQKQKINLLCDLTQLGEVEKTMLQKHYSLNQN